MGQASSFTPRARAHSALSEILPPYQQMEYNQNWIRVDKGMKVFTSVQERDQFIDALLTVITNTHSIPLQALSGLDSGFRLLYSRHPTSKYKTAEGQPTKVFASLVAMDDSGAIRAKIEPKEGGEDQREAFLKFREHVEIKLGEVLMRVDGGDGSSKVGGANGSVGGENGFVGGGRGETGPPPSYGELRAFGSEKKG